LLQKLDGSYLEAQRPGKGFKFKARDGEGGTEAAFSGH
jgi:hypothetical protein